MSDWDGGYKAGAEFTVKVANKSIAKLEAELTAAKTNELGLIASLHDLEEKCQFWCDEARKLGYREK